MKSGNHRKNLGSEGESRAVSFLEGHGFRILERNFRCGRRGEIDIIALRDNLLLFVEVKSRTVEAFGGPLRSISERKRSRMKSVAGYFLSLNGGSLERDVLCRFDLIAVEKGDIRWFQDVLR